VDGGREAAATLRSWNLLTDTLIGDNWEVSELRRALLNHHHDFNVLFASTTHNRILAPATVGDAVTAEEVAEVGSELAGSVVISAGSHLGLNVPDPWADAENRQDFSQVFAGLGATLIANTGYAYGGAHLEDLSESLAYQVIAELGRSPQQSVGEALVQAKRRVFDALGPAGLSVYLEKSLIEATLYGLPMLQVQLPTAGRGRGAVRERRRGGGRSAATRSTDAKGLPGPGLAVDRVQVHPRFRPKDTPMGTYFAADAGVAAWPGRPIQPRVTIDLVEPDSSAHGAVLVSARYRELRGFDPVITHPLLEAGENEGTYPFAAWWPRYPAAINRVPLADAMEERLVVIAGQYRYPHVERLYDRLTFDVYYSTSMDYRPPVIWEAQFTDSPQGADFNVWVSDTSGIQRVLVTYTQGDGQWRSIDLQDVGMGEHWFGFVPRLNGSGLEFFIQAVDTAGNVAVHTDKGRFFRPYVNCLPLVQR